MDEATESLKAGSVEKPKCNPYNLSFKNITCKVRCKKKRDKILLNDISGGFKAGRLTGILGPSGAGKSTLVNILAGFKTQGVTGHILINGKDRSNEDKWKSCCISQDPALLHLLTTKETLSVAADLKMPPKTSAEEKEKVIIGIADILNLKKSMDTSVGKLSGGEIKRLSIGVELVTNPPIMFFDEPTSGLDSVSSVQVISHLKDLAHEGRTIICVIHQPSSKIFDMFDDMILVSEGKIIYGGSVKEMVSTFQSAGFTCPQYYNRADFAIEVASMEVKGDLESLAAKSKEPDQNTALSDTTTRTNEFTVRENFDIIDEGEDYDGPEFSLRKSNDTHRSDYAVSQWRQFLILIRRSSKCTFRDLQLAYVRIGAHIMGAIALGLIYYQIGDDAAKIQSSSSFLFFMLLYIYFVNSMTTILTFPLEAGVFQRENRNHWYSLPAYYFSKIVADLPLQLFCPTVYTMIAYYMTGQPSEFWRLSMVWLVCIIFTIISHLTGLIVGVGFDAEMALFFLSAISVPMVIFSGFFVKFSELPGYMSGVTYLSHFSYGFEAIAQVIYGYERPKIKCSQPYCRYSNPEKFMDELSTRMSYKNDIICLICFMSFLYILLYVALVFKTRRSRM